MNKTPLVSVIIPNYNHARYLDQRIQTVLNQTYQNFEVIILDDKSTDNSLDVIAKYQNNPHIAQVVVNEQNSGSTFKQWDKGIHLAKGEIVWIAESDDYCELNMLEELVKAYTRKKNVVVAFSSYVLFSDEGYISRNKTRKSRYYTGLHFIRNKMAQTNAIMNASGAIFRKSTYYCISKNFLRYQSAGDYLFWVEMMAFGNIVVVNKNLTYFRLQSSSVTGTNRTKGITDKECKKIIDFIDLTYHLSFLQKWKAYAVNAQRCILTNYDNSEIKNEVMELWKIDRFSHKWLKVFFWLSSSIERHFGILI